MVSSHLLAIAMFGKAEENREKKEEHDDADPSHRDDISHFPNSHSSCKQAPAPGSLNVAF